MQNIVDSYYSNLFDKFENAIGIIQWEKRRVISD